MLNDTYLSEYFFMYDTKILLCRITNMHVRLVTTGIFKCLCYITSILLHTYFKALKLY